LIDVDRSSIAVLTVMFKNLQRCHEPVKPT
jgi:hypothetical protein